IRAGIAASLLLLAASTASADLIRPNKPKDVCKSGTLVTECSAHQGRLFTTVDIKTCGNGRTYGLVYGPRRTDGAVEKARFLVRRAPQPRRVMGAPVLWKGNGFALAINYTTAPRPDGAHGGSFKAVQRGQRWNPLGTC